MVYEPRQPRTFNYVMAGLCLALSLLGFFATGLIPSESTRVGGTYPLVGWIIIAACFGAAWVFLRRGGGAGVLPRMDEKGISVPDYTPDTIPWDQIVGLRQIPARGQQIVRFELKDPDRFTPATGLRRAVSGLDRALSYGHFGINTTFYDRRMDALLATVRHYRPDLFAT
jgi:hypothetical protein